jgi:phosphoribosylformylglycinamidine cyclo-ligase
VLDYLAVERADPGVMRAIGMGLKRGAELAGVEIPGGEVAVLPELIRGHPSPNGFDLTAACFGTVALDAIVTGADCRPGDALIGLPSSGLHSNGYSLVRHVFFERAGWDLDRQVDELGRTLGEELLTPTTVYAKQCLELVRALAGGVHAMSHITGGGLAANLARVVPAGLAVTVDRSTWTPQPVFGLVGELGSVPRDELEKTLNLGVGMVALVAPDNADRAIAVLAEQGVDGWVCGTVAAGDGTVELAGDYAR